MEKKKEDEVKLNLRLPTDLHSEIKAHAARERRSLNTMIIVCIEKCLMEQGNREEGAGQAIGG